MSQSPAPVAGPSRHGVPTRTDANLLRQFVMEYLQQHGFDKALQTFQQGIADQSGGDGEKDADGEDDGVVVGGSAQKTATGAGREAIFRAPGPVPVESTLKRNIPQAQSVSASTMSDRITPEFEAQAKYIIEQLQKRAEAKEGGDGKEAEDVIEVSEPGESLLDPSDRVEGYRRYRRWVDGGLDMWKPELDALSYPIFAHTFLDLMHFGFVKSAREFFEKHRTHHEHQHPQQLSSLSAIVDRQHLKINPYCQQLMNQKYTVAMSRNSHELLLQWLSGAGLDEEWENGLHSPAGRAKEAIKAIVFSRININVTNSAMPLDEMIIALSNGLMPPTIPPSSSIEAFNSATRLKLGPAPMTDKLREQVARTIQDEDEAANGDETTNSAAHISNGLANGDGDVDMTEEAEQEKGPIVQDVKLEPDTEKDADLICPDESETHPPVPAVFRIADLKREVEAVRDKRKMIRLGPGMDEKKLGESSSIVLPSVVAFTVFDGGEGVSSTEFSQDASLMAVGSPESCIRLWSLKGDNLRAKKIDPLDGTLVEDDGMPMRKLIGHSGPVYSLSFDPIHGSAASPQALLSSSQDGTVRLWSLDTYSNLVVYRGHNRDPVWDVEWGPMGVYFATASRDRTARLWSSDRITPLRMYTGHLSDVNCVRFHPNSLYLASGSNDSTCRLWDVQRGACIRLYLGHTDAVTTMSISPDGRLLASAGLDSAIWLWDLGSSRPIKRMVGHRSAVQSLSFSAESSVLVSGGLDATIRCWDVKSAGGKSIGRNGLDGDGMRHGLDAIAREHGALPLGPSGGRGDDGESTSDLLATFHTKRTPILKTHYTPRNLCMVAGNFIPPSNTVQTA